MSNRIRIAFLCGLAVGVTPFLLRAQGTEDVPTPGVTQELLLNSALSQFPGKQITVFTGRFEPGAATPLHKHPGTELLYVLEGSGEMQIAGRESLDMEPGRAILVQPNAGEDHFVHRAVNVSEAGEMMALVVVIHDQNTPPALPYD